MRAINATSATQLAAKEEKLKKAEARLLEVMLGRASPLSFCACFVYFDPPATVLPLAASVLRRLSHASPMPLSLPRLSA